MFERAIELDPSYAPAHIGLGNVDLRAIHHGWTSDPSTAMERAQGHAHNAIAADEFNPHAHALLGRIYSRLREYDRAVDALRRAIALNPSDPDNSAGLGDALLWSGDVNGAIIALESADRMDPQLSTQDLFNLGAAYFLADAHARAAHVLERVAARNEANPFIHAMLAAIYQEAGRPEQARRALAEMRRLNPLFDSEIFGSLFSNPDHRKKIISALQKIAS
jgi:adenylate cyclase